MKRLMTILLGLALGAFAAVAPAAASDVKGSADHPLVGRYEGSVIKTYQVKGYEETAFVDKAMPATGNFDPAPYTQRLAGKLTQILYEGPADRSVLEVVRNYEEALKGKGFVPVYACRQRACGVETTFWTAARNGIGLPSFWESNTYSLLKLERPEGAVWVSIFGVETKATANRPLTPSIALNVMEEKAMEADKVSVVAASALKSAIDATGRVAVYGLYFDVDKAELRPDSAPQLTEIAKLLKDNPTLSVLVVGHTDASGALAYNRTLSERRAGAIVNALTGQHGIAASRLFAVGVGPASPVATNRTEEGRAKNRRVEIVELPGTK